ncbi:Endoglucanase precursor [Leclercia adecarboxylata]|uniref:cellulase n=1 Tax=Leclercia adecarboxylata TaxID=83655 RepID=A0A4U9IS63_9ENTR|nr:Endoglucanase precursor [Leclercia adecarboxylata]
MYADGHVTPAKEWPARFSYDAIRVPLYVKWYQPTSPLMAPYTAYWGRFARNQTPAWVNITTNDPAPYMMEGGLLAVRDLADGATSGRRAADYGAGGLLFCESEDAGVAGEVVFILPLSGFWKAPRKTELRWRFLLSVGGEQA